MLRAVFVGLLAIGLLAIVACGPDRSPHARRSADPLANVHGDAGADRHGNSCARAHRARNVDANFNAYAYANSHDDPFADAATYVASHA